MLSYRHAFHAGNFADVLKHVVLTATLRYLVRKDAPLLYLDTHAGAGLYDLHSPQAARTGESAAGIGRLWGMQSVPDALAHYLEVVRQCNDTSALHRYPGSPWFAARVLRARDRLVLFERHSSDFPVLQQVFQGDRRVTCRAEDSYQCAPGLMPPAQRRGLVLMDPAYELAGEYELAMATLTRLYRRFTTGTYALWYPVLDESRSVALRRQLEKQPVRDVLHIALRVADGRSRSGMYGSGMIVINPPWTLRDDMAAALPFLAEHLGAGPAAGFALEQWIEE